MYTFISHLWVIPFIIFVVSSTSNISLKVLHKTNVDDEAGIVNSRSGALMTIMTISLVLFIVLFFLIESTKMPTRNVAIIPEPIDAVAKDTFTDKVIWKNHGEIHIVENEDCVFIEVDKTKLDIAQDTPAPYHTIQLSSIDSDIELPYHEVIRTQYCDSVQVFGRKFNSKPYHSLTFHRFYIPKGYFKNNDKEE